MINQTSREHSGALGRCEHETDSLLCLWVEPWAPDHWMRPGEVFTVATRADPENAPFNVVVHGQGISVWVNAGLDAEVFDAQGGLVPCAHQRPDGVFKSAAR
jgi:hypothetical protein